MSIRVLPIESGRTLSIANSVVPSKRTRLSDSSPCSRIRFCFSREKRIGGEFGLRSRGPKSPLAREKSKPLTKRTGFGFRASASKNDPGPSGEWREDGDADTQDVLVQMVRLQTSRVRVDSFVEEKSRQLTNIAEEADSELTRIAKEAEESMAQSGKKILDDMEERTRALEEELAQSRAELEERDRKMVEFEDHVANVRSQGLFFKSLYQSKKSWKERSPEEKEAILKEAKTLASDAKQAALGSSSRKRIYQILAFILSLGVVEGLLSEEISWLKVGVYSALLISVALQLSFEDKYSNLE